MDKKQTLGPILMLLASICFAGGGAALKFIPWSALAINGARNTIAVGIFIIYMILTKHKLKVNRTVLAGACCAFGVTTMFVIANKMTTAGNAIILQFTCPVWIILAVLFLGVVQLGLAYILFTYGTKYTHPVTASLINGVEPVLNPIIVALMFGEVLSKMSLLGAFIVIGAVLVYLDNSRIPLLLQVGDECITHRNT